MRYITTLIGLVLIALGLGSVYIDITTADTPWLDTPWHSIGEIWFLWAPASLQVAESIISRYIDPCGLIIALDCAPFLWHPLISQALQWYATPAFLGGGFVLLVLVRWLGRD